MLGVNTIAHMGRDPCSEDTCLGFRAHHSTLNPKPPESICPFFFQGEQQARDLGAGPSCKDDLLQDDSADPQPETRGLGV